MKGISKLFGLIVLASMILLSACTPPPPPVSKDQLGKAEEETVKIETQAKDSAKRKAELQKDLQVKEEKLSALKQIDSENK